MQKDKQINVETLFLPSEIYIEPDATKKWDTCPAPFDDESFLSWFTRLAKANYSDTDLLYAKFGGLTRKFNKLQIQQEFGKIQIDKKMRSTLITNINDFISLKQDSIEKLINGSFLELKNKITWDYFLIPRVNPHYCIYCLKDDKIPYFRNYWYLRFYVTCHIHNVLLQSSCPHCDQPISFWKTIWNESILECINCQKTITEGINAVTEIKDGLISQYQFNYLCIYQKTSINQIKINPIYYFRQILKLIFYETKDLKLKEDIENAEELGNYRILKELINIQRLIDQDYDRIEKPYLCEKDNKRFFTSLELEYHIKAIHKHEFDMNTIQDEEVKRRFEMIYPLLELPNRSRDNVKRYAESNDISVQSIYRYIKRYEEEGINGLIPRISKRGNKKKKISNKVENLIFKHITYKCNCCNSESSIKHKYEMIRLNCIEIGVKTPTLKTVRKRIKD